MTDRECLFHISMFTDNELKEIETAKEQSGQCWPVFILESIRKAQMFQKHLNDATEWCR